LTPTARTPGPWRSMPPRLAYVWLRGLVGQRQAERGKVAIVSADLLRKVRRHLKPARAVKAVPEMRIRWRSYRIDGHVVIGDTTAWDRFVYWIDVPQKDLPCFRIAP
jgi:hypothetical protein